ncbi:crotonase/enoyl-CoA hydratase family protein [Brevibacterium sp. CBA3109]|uniref:Crotonase/enoyl-CoA hydratase family protein n=1 Tax=Brevibacterium koreense TaxID=3140787 RepID=A0AAU7UNK8_9MICO
MTDHSPDLILITRPAPAIELWSLNLPEQRNPITDEPMIDALVGNIDRIREDETVKCVVLTGEGKAFSAGGNIKKMADKSGMFGGDLEEIRQGYRDGVQRIPLAMRSVDVPFIAAVNGPAVGAGMDLTTMCDMRVASDHAWFAESFVQLGLIAGDGGAWFLPRLIGAARAAEMALTGDRVDAVTAERWGLVNYVVPADELIERALELAGRVAANPVYSVRATKQLLLDSERHTLASMLEDCASLQATAHFQPDHHEAVAAMLEKRTPRFTS